LIDLADNRSEHLLGWRPRGHKCCDAPQRRLLFG